MALDEPAENETTVQVAGFEMLIDEKVRPYASGNILDYVNSHEGEGFVLHPESGQCC